jgi:hypothetical protein
MPNEHNKNDNMHPISSGIAGLVSGAIIGAGSLIVAVILSDKRVRDQIKKSMNETKKQIKQSMDSAKKTYSDTKDVAKEKIKEIKEGVTEDMDE